ncbi:MAG: ABC transporter permease, partial [Bacteroidota bacterium]
MLSNNSRLILRTLCKQSSFTLIHITGLTLGLTCCLLIYLFIQHERSFDTLYSNADRIFKVCQIDQESTGPNYSGGTPYPTAPAIRTDMPGLEQVARIHHHSESLIKLANGQKFSVDDIIYAEPELTKIFDLPVINGDLQATLAQPNQAAITQSLAEKLFGTENPVGQVIGIDNKIEVTISSLMKDNPANSSLSGQLYVSYESFSEEILGFPIDQWGLSVGGVTFILIDEKESVETYEAQLPQFVDKYMSDDKAITKELYLQPLKDFHFEAAYSNPLTNRTIKPLYLWIFGSVGVFILLIAIFNFVNLSTVQALKRSKESGVRKVLGAAKGQLMGQILGEALVLTAFSGVLATVLGQFSLPFINELLDKKISDALFYKPTLWLFLMGTILLVGLSSGIYPALSFANFQPMKVLKSRTTAGNRNTLWIRRTLVVTQFVITIALIIGTLIVSQQLNFLKNKDLGFSKEAIINVAMPEQDHFDRLRTQWLQNPNVEKVSFNIGAPTSLNDINTTFYQEGKQASES